VNSALDGSWDYLEQELAVVLDPAVQQPDRTTAFPCDAPAMANMRFMVRVWDEEGVGSDCAAWGSDVSAYERDGCRILATPDNP
jgi:hypothetical protein